jgi:F0F1-type ATP synthase assembly protein I
MPEEQKEEQKRVYEEVKKGGDGVSWRQSKKARLGVLVGLIVVAIAIGFFFEKTRLWMLGIVAILLIGVGLEVNNTDYDLGKMMETKSISQSKVLRDKEGNIVTDSKFGKATDEYNCADFENQPQAQRFFDRAGGVTQDTNRLDGNKDGAACQSLPAGAK